MGFYYSALPTAQIIFGDDILHGAQGGDLIYGDLDFAYAFSNVVGFHLTFGNDRIIGGESNDYMAGDFGSWEPRALGIDLGGGYLRLCSGSGHDAILDFGYGNDRLDVSGYGYTDFSQIVFGEFFGSTVIDLDGTAADIASITLSNYTTLSASDSHFCLVAQGCAVSRLQRERMDKKARKGKLRAVLYIGARKCLGGDGLAPQLRVLQSDPNHEHKSGNN